MSKIFYVLGIALTALTFSSCGDDDEIHHPNYEEADVLPYAIYETKGTVVNEDNQPLSGINVTLSVGVDIVSGGQMQTIYKSLDDATVTTDEKGEFTITKAYINTYAFYLSNFRFTVADPSGAYKSQTLDCKYTYKSLDNAPELDTTKYKWMGRYTVETSIILTK